MRTASLIPRRWWRQPDKKGQSWTQVSPATFFSLSDSVPSSTSSPLCHFPRLPVLPFQPSFPSSFYKSLPGFFIHSFHLHHFHFLGFLITTLPYLWVLPSLVGMEKLSVYWWRNSKICNRLGLERMTLSWWWCGANSPGAGIKTAFPAFSTCSAARSSVISQGSIREVESVGGVGRLVDR